MSKKVLAVDYGASSGRGILAELDNGRITLTELARFDNTPVRLGGRLYWDIFRLYHDLKRCLAAARDHDIQSVAIDTWGVDFAVVSDSGELAASPVHYRDGRTAGMTERLTEKGMSREKLYELTGIEIMEINTLFQLMSLMGSEDNRIKLSDELLFMPDYLNFLLCGKRSTEPCIASTSQLLDARTKQWSEEIISAAGLGGICLPEIVQSGTVLGQLTPELCGELGIKSCNVSTISPTRPASAARPRCSKTLWGCGSYSSAVSSGRTRGRNTPMQSWRSWRKRLPPFAAL